MGCLPKLGVGCAHDQNSTNKEMDDTKLQDECMTKLLQSFRLVRCSYTHYDHPANFFLASLRPSDGPYSLQENDLCSLSLFYIPLDPRHTPNHTWNLRHCQCQLGEAISVTASVPGRLPASDRAGQTNVQGCSQTLEGRLGKICG